VVMIVTKLKTRKCKVCKEVFQKKTPLHCLCSGACATKHMLAQNVKKKAKEQLEDRRETKKKLDAIKSIPKLIAEAQAEFNAFIRERDKDQLCICCNKPYGTNALGGNFDAGHFRTRGAAGHLRFNEDNCFGQRKYCNTYHAGDFRAGVIKRIGLVRTLAVENNNDIKKWTREDLIEIKNKYKLKTKELKSVERLAA